MGSSLCNKIREKNIKEYGTRVDVWAPKILASLYSDRTHFVYELLQNAEDACERARKKGKKGRFYVRFNLYPDRLEVRHNGIHFDERDVTGICGIVEAEKDEATLQIGKFGIGFKSVYAYTTSPEVYGGDSICPSCARCAFHIKDYVHPYPIRSREDLTTEETLFVISFDREDVQKGAYTEIETRLKDLGIRTLLFLNNLEEISYKASSISGRYLRRSKMVNGAKQVSLHHVVGEQEKQTEKWLIFEKTLDRDESRKIEIAYLLAYDPTSKKDGITSARDVRLFAYFQTQMETHLRFLIQGPYNTTPARDNIKRDDEWNQELIEETATLVADSLSKVKTFGLLDLGFLRTLPIDMEYFTQESTLFRPIYEKVKAKLLSDDAFLPAYGGSFATTDQALIARGRDLCSLLSTEQLDNLFERKGSRWLDENITEDRTPELWEYLTKALGIIVVDPDRFAAKLNEEFMDKQSDQWVISFYSFLLGHEALCKRGTIIGGTYYGKPGVLLSKPIIRLDNDSHVLPYDKYTEKPNAYLPHRDPNMRKIVSNVVKDTIVLDERAKKFLQNLGICEPDETLAIMNTVLPKYNETIVSEKDNVQHVTWILKTLEKEPQRKRDLLEELKKTPFLYAVNAASLQEKYRKPREIHLGETYTGSKNLEIYFDGNEDAWFLSGRYETLRNDKENDLKEKLELIGCPSAILVHTRLGLDKFNPECKIEGLEHALKNITYEKAKILWDVTKACRKNICNEIIVGFSRDLDGLSENRQYSEMGELLVENSWLPKSESSPFFKPSQLMLKELPDDFDKRSLEAKDVSQRLGFKPEFDRETQEILEEAPEDARVGLRKVVEVYTSLSPEKQQRLLEIGWELRTSEEELPGIESLEQEKSTLVSVSPTPLELKEEFKKALKKERPSPSLPEDRTWKGPTPEQEERLRELAEKTLTNLSKKPQVIEKVRKAVSRTKIDRDEEAELRSFLLEQYAGHCQICYTRLDLGPDKDPYFEVYRIIKKRREVGSWSDQEFNVLCLCPNCHALMMYGGRDLDKIWRIAARVVKGEVAPDEVNERGGDFYIIPVTIAGKERELFIAPVHMAMIAAFVKITEDRYQDSVHALTYEESRELYLYKCSKCGRLYSAEDVQKDHFCRKCGTWLRPRKT